MLGFQKPDTHHKAYYDVDPVKKLLELGSKTII
jgi:hypothetical protein